MAQEQARGSFVWHELLTNDTGSAASFYGRLVGWKVQPWEHNAAYSLWMAPGGPVGGLMVLPPEAKAKGAPPHWLSYVGTLDVDTTLRDAQRLGARVYKGATDIPGAGRFAVLADPQGATFAIYQPEPSSSGGPSGFSWHELATTDVAAALQFYQALFGWQKSTAFDMGPGGSYQLFKLAGKDIGGIYIKPKDMPAPPNWLCYASVGDADQVAMRAKSAGGRVLNGPMDVPGGDRIVVVMDPQGAAFAVHARAKAVKTAPAAAATTSQPAAAASKPKRRAAAKRRKPAKKKVVARKRRAAKRKVAARKTKRTTRRAVRGKRRVVRSKRRSVARRRRPK